MTAKELRERRAKLIADSRTILDAAETEKRELTKEEDEQFERLHVEQEKLKKDIDRIERQEKLDAEMRAPAGDPAIGKPDLDGRPGDGAATVTEEHRALALQAWCRRQMGLSVSTRHKEACKLVGVNTRSNAFDFRLEKNYRTVRRQSRQAAWGKRAEYFPEMRAQSINVNTAGGYTIPEGFVANLEVALLAYANVRDYADVMRTDSGQDLPWPTNNDTTNKGQILGENTQVSEVDLTVGQVIFHAYKYTTNLILVPAELLEDSAFNLAEFIGERFGVRLGRIQADHFTTGTGVGQPTGFLTAATLGITAASATAIAADELYATKHSVDPAYRPGAIWTMHDNTLLAIKKLKDGFGRYLWQASLAGGRPDTIDGDPLMINQSMAALITNSAVVIAYGDFSKYKIRDVNQIRMRRLVERYADSDQEGFVGFSRHDANLLDAGTHPIKTYQMHS